MNRKKREAQSRRNLVRLKNCRLHNFDWKRDIDRYKKRRDEAGVILGNFTPEIMCRCKNCGGKVLISCAVGYMEALKHISEIGENGAITRKQSAPT